MILLRNLKKLLPGWFSACTMAGLDTFSSRAAWPCVLPAACLNFLASAQSCISFNIRRLPIVGHHIEMQTFAKLFLADVIKPVTVNAA